MYTSCVCVWHVRSINEHVIVAYVVVSFRIASLEEVRKPEDS